MRWFAIPSAGRAAIAATLAAFLVLALTSACDRLEPPQESGELVIGVRGAPSLDGSDGPDFDRDLVESFAATLGVKARYIEVPDPQTLRGLLRDGKVHLAATLPLSGADPEGLRHTSPVRSAKPVLVRHVDALGLDDIEDLAGHTVEVVAGTPQAASLKALPESRRPRVVERNDMDTVGLLRRVAERTSELAAADTVSYAVAANLYPDLAVAAELPGEVRFVWGFPEGGDPALFQRATAFLAHVAADGTLRRLTDRHFGHIERVDATLVAELHKKRISLLPRYRRDFVTAQELTGIDWRLLAALAWQESQWDPLATSPTGVRGMMMLTEETADHMRVSNRLDAAESIRAGARYLADLIAQLPPSVVEPDRTWLALAAYNLGMGHLNGARAIAKGLKRDADSWYEMKQVLPLLARPEYYERLKSGRARGGEAVILVENVRTYYAVLARFEPALKLSLTPPFRR